VKEADSATRASSVGSWSLRTSAEVLLPLLAAVVLFAVLRQAGVRGMFPAASGRVLSVDPSKFTCNAQQSEIVTAAFTLKNTGNQPIRVLGADASCSCVIAEGLPVELQPGRSGTVSLLVSVGTPGADGKFRKSVNLLVNRGGSVPPLVVEAAVIPTRLDGP
jgi:uncharacterized protein DUF1573